MNNNGEIEKSYSKCWVCMGQGSAVEKDVYFFPKLAVCVCDYHLNEMVKNTLGLRCLREEGE